MVCSDSLLEEGGGGAGGCQPFQYAAADLPVAERLSSVYGSRRVPNLYSTGSGCTAKKGERPARAWKFSERFKAGAPKAGNRTLRTAY